MIFSPSSFKSFLKLYFDRKMLIVLVLGFAGGLPLMLYSSTLAYWMSQEAIDLKTIGLFGLASFPASFKFLWAPLVDRLPVPYFSRRLGQRRAWLLLSQFLSSLCLYGMSLCHPVHHHLTLLAGFSVVLALGTANQNILILTYQVESFQRKVYGASEAVCVVGYRIGLLLAGALPLYLSEFWSWSSIYQLMAGLSGIGLLATFFMEEPPAPVRKDFEHRQDLVDKFSRHPRWLALLTWIHGAVICPFKVFIKNKGWLASLLIIFLYKVGDNMIGSMSNIFYSQKGYAPADIANAIKIFGMWSSLLGGLIGGYIISRISIYKGLFYFGLIHAIALFSYLFVSFLPKNLSLLYMVSGLEHFTGGLSLTALFSYQMLLSDARYATTQLALLTSFSHMGRSLFAAPAGYLIESFQWEGFFILAALASFTVLPLILWLERYKEK